MDRQTHRRLLISLLSAVSLAGLAMMFMAVAVELAPSPGCNPGTGFCELGATARVVLMGAVVGVLAWSVLLTLVLFRLGFNDLRWMIVVTPALLFSVAFVLAAFRGWVVPLLSAAGATWFMQSDPGSARRARDLKRCLVASLRPGPPSVSSGSNPSVGTAGS